MNIDYISIGKRIKNFRVKKSWNQVTLAEKSGVEPSNISHIERAATKVSLPNQGIPYYMHCDISFCYSLVAFWF